MGKILDSLKNLFGGRPVDRTEVLSGFSSRYASFKNLLQANTDLSKILAGLDAASRGEKHMDVDQVRHEARRAMACAGTMSEALISLSGGRHYKTLREVLRNISAHIEDELVQHAPGDVTELTLPLTEVDATMTYSVGAKNANLGELANMLGLPVPRGFAVTIRTGQIFLSRYSGLFDLVQRELAKIDVDHPKTIDQASSAIAEAIMYAPMPRQVEEALLRAYDESFGGRRVRVALRSSAIAEDGMQSFAGQYESILGVTRDTLITAWRRVFASLYSPRALTYRLRNGYELSTSGMGMCCLEMINAKAAGVAFTRHPVNLRSNDILINGVWGLGEAVADGSATPDQWLVSRATMKIAHETIATKLTRVVLSCTDNGVEPHPEDVSEPMQNVPCLTRDQVRQIAAWALKIEHHYQYPQDIEWAVDQEDQLILLQARPMGFDSGDDDQRAPELEKIHPLLSGCDVAAKGVACGKVMHVDPDADLTHFPEGWVMVLPHSSPNATVAMQRACAIVAETGSLTGHMASVCREYGVPTLMNARGAMEILEENELVTVDALRGRVFRGEIPELLELKINRRPPAADTPSLALLRRISGHILPLHMVDPRSPNFKAQNCTSLHDLMRFVHEKSYSEMFKLSDSVTEGEAGAASRFRGAVPLDLYIIDLGGGLRDPSAKFVTQDDVISTPLRYVIAGMLNPAVQSREPRPVNMHGFLSVMGNSMAGGNKAGGDRFGDHSYAIVSDNYLNFSSRVGYHYAILDCWCGKTLSKNYIRFEFAGGAAGSVQRERRVRCIGCILTELGFTVSVLGDRIQARYQKYPRDNMLPRLDQIGRLLIMTRQMDMLMTSEAAVQEYAHRFLNGQYH